VATVERHFAIYAISFVVIALHWIAHHFQFHCARYTVSTSIST
jgi:uncharacterized membrane protein